MTDPDKISRSACAPATRVSPWLLAEPERAVARPPYAIRKTLCTECHLDDKPLPFFPRVAFYQEARVLFGNRTAETNHRRRLRRSQSRPTLAAASCCLLCSLGALFATSPRGEESLAGVARTVIQASSDAGMMASNSSD